MLDRYDYYIPQVGEIVRVKHFDHEEAMPDGLTFTYGMLQYCGEEFYVQRIRHSRGTNLCYISDCDKIYEDFCSMSNRFGGYFFTSYMIEPVAEPLNNIDFSNLI